MRQSMSMPFRGRVQLRRNLASLVAVALFAVVALAGLQGGGMHGAAPGAEAHALPDAAPGAAAMDMANGEHRAGDCSDCADSFCSLCLALMPAVAAAPPPLVAGHVRLLAAGPPAAPSDRPFRPPIRLL